MRVEEHVPLSTLTTFKIGGRARYVLHECAPDELPAAHSFADSVGLPLIPLGEGSNVLAPDHDLDVVVVRIRDDGYVRTDASTDSALLADTTIAVSVSAGMSWDPFVTAVGTAGWWGIENLAAIPGTVGASPVQNIGAYGCEVSQVIDRVEAYEMHTRNIITIPVKACEFAYRTSLFKREPRYIITRVGFVFSRIPSPNIAYPDLVAYSTLSEGKEVMLETPLQIASAIRTIRGKKFPDLLRWGTAGSFFKNPVVTIREYDILALRYAGMPGFPTNTGIKIPLAWILDHILHLNGYKKGHTKLFESQPLVLVAEPGATAEEVRILAHDVIEKVFNATGIRIEKEVISFEELISK